MRKFAESAKKELTEKGSVLKGRKLSLRRLARRGSGAESAKTELTETRPEVKRAEKAKTTAASYHDRFSNTYE